MTEKRYNILIAAGGSPQYQTVTTHINNLIGIFTRLSQNVYLLSSYDKDLINLKKSEIFTIQTFHSGPGQFVKNQFLELKAMYKIFKNQKIEVVFFAFGQDLQLIPVLFSKIMGKKIILRSDGRPSLVIEKYLEDQSVFKRYFFRVIEYMNYKLVDILASECNYMIKENNQDRLNNCIVANLPVDIDFFNFKIPFKNRKYDLGYIGQLHKLKGIMKFIETIPLIVNNNNNISVIIGGEGDLKEEIIQFIVKNDLERNIHTVDWIQHENLPEYLNSIKIFVFPSSKEGLPNTILEAMACGTPVVASQVGGLAYLVQDGVTGFTVPVEDPQALADRLMSLLSDPELRLKMGEQAFTYAQGYAWERIAQRLVSVYAELCGEVTGSLPGANPGL